ncbi:MAG: adenylate/guanylate cyclase domain-containing protein [Chloroflexota bacterium]
MTQPVDPRLAEEQRRAHLVLTGTDEGLRRGRRLLKMLPSSPRCKLCASPFSAPLGPFMRLLGKGPWPKNPKYCTACFRELVQHRAGAEIDCSLLFADVRGSTALAETMRPMEFTTLMNHFFETASRVLVGHDAIVDKFVGDEVIGIFVPGLTGPDHARHAIDAGRQLLATTSTDTSLEIGIGVNSGVAYVGAVGEGEHVELTAMGDPVNVAARLASAAGPGELLASGDAARAAALDTAGLERRNLELKGKREATEVYVLHAS